MKNCPLTIHSPVLIVSSAQDTASMNLRKHLLDLCAWKETGTLWGSPLMSMCSDRYMALLPDEHIYHDNIDLEAAGVLHRKPGLVVVLSRHRSEAGTRSLTVHPIGNYGQNDFGGKAGRLVPSSPGMMASILRNLTGAAEGLDYAVTYEVTHHGPYLETPTLFVEIGSGESEWTDPEAGGVVARALYGVLSESLDEDVVLVGIGGGHYAPRFSDIVMKRKACFGHMLPSYAVEGLDVEDVKKRIIMAVDSTPGAQGVYVHRKGLGSGEKRTVSTALQELGLKVVGTEDIPLRIPPPGNSNID